METLIHADFFFFVTTIAIIILIIVLLIIGYYSFRIFRKAESIVDDVKQEGQKIVADIGDLRQSIKDEGSKVKSLTSLIMSFMANKVRPKAKKKSKASDETEEVNN